MATRRPKEQPRAVRSIERPKPHRCALELSKTTPFACTAGIDSESFHKRRVTQLSALSTSYGLRPWSSNGPLRYLRRIAVAIVSALRARHVDYVDALAGIQDGDYWHVERQFIKTHGCLTELLKPGPHRCAFELSTEKPLACTARIDDLTFHRRRVAELGTTAAEYGLPRRDNSGNLPHLRSTAEAIARDLAATGVDCIKETFELILDRDYWNVERAFFAKERCLAEQPTTVRKVTAPPKHKQPKSRANKPNGIEKRTCTPRKPHKNPTRSTQLNPATRTRSRLDLRSQSIHALGLR